VEKTTERGTLPSVLLINETSGACSMYDGEERCIQSFGGET
jgi:hypothetical protein